MGLIPGGEVVGGFLSLIGIGLNAASENMEDQEPEVPDYDQIEAGMGKYLGTFFQKTRDEMDNMLAALFGEIDGDKTDDALLRSMIERMGKLGVRELNKDAESPIAEILKGGEFLKPISNNEVKRAFDKGFKGMVSTIAVVHVRKLTASSKELLSATFLADFRFTSSMKRTRLRRVRPPAPRLAN